MRTALLAGAVALLSATALSAQTAEPEGEIYAAHGTEPFWGLTFEDGKIVYSTPDDERIEVRRPRPVTTRGGVHVYQTPRMRIEISHEGRCSDGMSDYEYPDTVRVYFGRGRSGRPLEGCGGGILPPVTLVNSGWAIVEIDGAQVGGEDYELQFDDQGRLSGRAGCNRFSGPYTQSTRSLRPGAIVATRRACSDDRSTYERKLLRLLSGPVELRYRGGMLMVLSADRDGQRIYVTLRRH